MMDQIKDLLARVPVAAIVAVLMGYVGFDYYSFQHGELQRAKDDLAAQTVEVEGMANKVQQAKKFYETLNQKRAELRGLAQQLEQMKATLTDTLDVPSFMKMVVVEAARVGLTVLAIKPTESKAYDYYYEQVFDFEFRAVYPQLLVFLDRLSTLETIIRIDSFDVKGHGNPAASFVEIGGVLQLKAYRYVVSKADEIGKITAASQGSSAGAGTPAPVNNGGASDNGAAAPPAGAAPAPAGGAQGAAR